MVRCLEVLTVGSVPYQGARNCLHPGPSSGEKDVCSENRDKHPPLESVPSGFLPGDLQLKFGSHGGNLAKWLLYIRDLLLHDPDTDRVKMHILLIIVMKPCAITFYVFLALHFCMHPTSPT
jgi:hypothetical protein